MTYIALDEVTVDFPIYSTNARSLRTRVLRIATGGGIGKREDGRVVVRALDNVTLHVRDGERVGLFGNNGAGKTTLLRVLRGVYYPVQGSLSVEGKVGSLLDIAVGIDPEATGRENLTLRGTIMGLSRAEIANKAEEIIDFAELGDFIDAPVRTYSSGMQLRLAFAISTTVNPDILLMDEWLSVGDSQFSAKVRRRLADLVDRTRILVIASHDVELLKKTCNRLIWLEKGRIRMDGDPEEVAAACARNDEAARPN